MMSKTIKQIANEIGVSKQAVYKRFKGKLHTVCAPYAHTVQGVLYIDENGEKLIKQDFLKEEHSNGAHPYIHTDHSVGAPPKPVENDKIISVLQSAIDALNNQLEEKDKQLLQQAKTIENLSIALADAEKSIHAAQALHAGTIEKQLINGKAAPDSTYMEQEKKKNLWQKIFKRK